MARAPCLRTVCVLTGGWWHTVAGCVTLPAPDTPCLSSLSTTPVTRGGEGGGLYREQSFTRYNLSCAEARELVVVGTGDQYVATNKEY